MKVLVVFLSCLSLSFADADAKADATPDAAPDANAKGKSSYHATQAPFYGHTASLQSSYNSYSPPAYKPEPAYNHYPTPEPELVILEQPSYPKQNCTVQDEALRAEICVPDFQTKCDEEGLMSKKLVTGEFCYDVTRTECKQVETTAEIEVCSFDMDREEQSAKAKTVEVEFKQECSTQMVTVCEPVQYQPAPQPTYPPYAAPGYHQPPPPPPKPQPVYQQCKEVEQETCYNIPQLIEKEIEVTMGFPKPSKDCKTETVTIPEIQCEDIVESKCQNIPRIVEEPDNIESCRVEVGPPKCSEVELVLPKQVCQDIVYGYADEIKPQYPEPQPAYHHPAPQPSYHAPQPSYHGHA